MPENQPRHAEAVAPRILLASQRYAQELADRVARLKIENAILRKLLSAAQTDILRHECGQER